VFLCTTLDEIPDREAALRQSFAALKPGGLLSITEIFPDPHYQSKRAGFELQTIEGGWVIFTANFLKPETSTGG
jgi:ubiquinone/menaquinone biosynthesis C-methylase UbiE